MLEHPRKVGAYKLIEPLGQGNMGTVFAAERDDGQFQKRVAIKFVRSDRFDSKEVLQRFRSEQRILASLEHPHIAGLLDAGHDKDTDSPYLIMEYIDGLPIDIYCKNNQLSLTQRLDLFVQICKGISHAHRNLVIHRDIKPSNILVTSSGQVKILDFGIAKVIAENTSGQQITELSHTPFTPRYASPEQITNEHLTTASDTFSLGVLLYELLTDCPLYQVNHSNYQLAKEILDTHPTAPSAAVLKQLKHIQESSPEEIDSTFIADDSSEQSDASEASIPTRVKNLSRMLKGDLDKIVLKTLRKKPNERYGSVDELLHDIERYRLGYPVQASGSNLTYRLGKLIKRQKVLSLAILAILALGSYSLYALNIRAQDLSRMAAQNRQVGEFFSSLFQDLDPYKVNSEKLSALDVLNRAYEKVKHAFPNNRQARMIILRDAGSIFRDLGQFKKAEELLSEALEISLGPAIKLSETVKSHQEMISYYLSHSELGEAERLLEHLDMLPNKQKGSLEQDTDLKTVLLRVQLLNEKALFEEADKYLNAMEPTLSDVKDVNLIYQFYFYSSNAAIRLGEFETANLHLQKLKDVVDSNEDQLLARRAEVYSLISLKFRRESKFQESIDQLQQAKIWQEKVLGVEHPDNIALLESIGSDVIKLGDVAKGTAYIESALKLSRKVYGENHLKTATVYNNLAVAYMDQRKLDEAGDLLEKSVTIQKTILGPKHPSLATTIANVSTIYARHRNFDKSIPLQKEAIEIMIEAHGEDHPRTLKYQQDLAIDLIESGQVGEGLPIAEMVYEKTLAKFGEKSEPLAWAASTLANAYKRLGKLGQAKKLANQAIEIYQSHFGDDHFELPTFYYHLLDAAVTQKDHDTVIKFGEKVIANVELNKGKTYFTKGYAAGAMADSYVAKGNLKKASELYQLSIDDTRKILGRDDVVSIRKLQNIKAKLKL